jgi:hypothetical protein
MNSNPPNNVFGYYVPPRDGSYTDINSTDRTGGANNYPTLTPSAVIVPQTSTELTQVPTQNLQQPINMETNYNYIPSLSCNQVSDLKTLNKELKSNAQLIICPFCKQTSFTKAEKKWNFGSVLCGLMFGVGVWVVYQIVRKKDINCMDAKHYCTRCGVQVADYTSC